MSKQKFLLLLVPVFLLVAVIAQAQGIKIPTSGETGLPDGSVSGVLNTVLNWLLMIFVIIATISFVITGLQFIFSFGGASGSEAQAKKNFTYTIIAIFIVGGSLIILKTIIGLLGPVSSGGAGGNNTNNPIQPVYIPNETTPPLAPPENTYTPGESNAPYRTPTYSPTPAPVTPGAHIPFPNLTPPGNPQTTQPGTDPRGL